MVLVFINLFYQKTVLQMEPSAAGSSADASHQQTLMTSDHTNACFNNLTLVLSISNHHHRLLHSSTHFEQNSPCPQQQQQQQMQTAALVQQQQQQQQVPMQIQQQHQSPFAAQQQQQQQQRPPNASDLHTFSDAVSQSLDLDFPSVVK